MEVIVRRYKKDGDFARGARTLPWMKESVFISVLDDYWREGGSVLDVGSGNGRINSFLKKYYDEIHNLDLYLKTEKQFRYKNVTDHGPGDFMTHKFDRKFNTIFMFATFRLFVNKYLALQKCVDLLDEKGQIAVIEDPKFGMMLKGPELSYNLREMAPHFDMYADDFITKKHPMRITFLRRKSEFRETREITVGKEFTGIEKSVGMDVKGDPKLVEEKIKKAGTKYKYKRKDS